MSAHLTRPLLIVALALVPPLGIVSAAATPTGPAPAPAVTNTSESNRLVRDASVRDASVGGSPVCDWRYGSSCVVGGRM
ncbi:hypothetical protein AB0I16_06545 [Streptomyces sp. NPDC050703]|uniref:hypothetical protein n=1 Tax=Streptomyces sp. NPDC050703 TaxID=3157218 RepID=UPI0034248340